MQLNFFRALANVLGLTWARVRSDFLSHSWVTITLGITVTALMFVPDADNYLRFDSVAILEAGEWWRIFTAVFVHSSWDHYTWNVIVLVASSLVCEQINRRAFVIYLIAVITVTAAYKLTLAVPGHVSLGFSGVASGTFVLLLMLITAEGITTRDFWMVVVSSAILVVFSAHELGFFGDQTGWEMLTGRSIDSTPGKKTKPAHVLGMLTGFVVASGYLFTAAVIRKRQ